MLVNFIKVADMPKDVIEKYKNHPELLIPYEEVKREIRNEFGI